ncbi:hypothetical protein, partial [Hyphomicrobium sp.]|uniref:hypothetical protein n=1 Tax=Hyphomicrobium sp. TaxID=82 RepID=UPI0025BCE2E1
CAWPSKARTMRRPAPTVNPDRRAGLPSLIAGLGGAGHASLDCIVGFQGEQSTGHDGNAP